jgi:hypothetical protein
MGDLRRNDTAYPDGTGGVDEWMGGWVDGWMDGWVDGWMSGKKE